MTTDPASIAVPGGLPRDRLNQRYAANRLRRVSRPTTTITGEVARFDEREHGFNRALRGDYDPAAQHDLERFEEKYPLSGAMVAMELAGKEHPPVDCSPPARALS